MRDVSWETSHQTRAAIPTILPTLARLVTLSPHTGVNPDTAPWRIGQGMSR